MNKVAWYIYIYTYLMYEATYFHTVLPTGLEQVR